MNLNELKGASLDFEKVLKLEPNNKAAKKHLETIQNNNFEKVLKLAQEENKKAAKNHLKTKQNPKLPKKPQLPFMESVPNFYMEYVSKYGSNPNPINDQTLLFCFNQMSAISSRTLKELVDQIKNECQQEGD